MSGSEIAELFKRDNGNVHRAAAKIIVSKSRAARGSVCNVLLSGRFRRDDHVIMILDIVWFDEMFRVCS